MRPFTFAPIFMLLNSLTKHQRIWIIFSQMILTVSAILICLFYLMRIYEVPVYTTEFQILREGVMDSSDIHISIVRDYDIYESENGMFRNKNKHPSGIRIEGLFYNKTDIARTNMLSKDNMLYSKLADVKNNAKIDINNNLGELVYLMIRGKSRQFMGGTHGSSEKTNEYYNDTIRKITDYYHYGVMNEHNNVNERYCKRNQWVIPFDTLFQYAKQTVNKEEFLTECIFLNSKGDNSIPVFHSISGGNFKKPNPFFVLEDFSKLVEVIRIPPSSAQFVKSLTIDYMCPTDFGTLYPKPDVMTYGAIRYTDPNKLNQIAWNGLEYHAEFPDMENFQDVRLFAITTIVTILITIFFKLIYSLLKECIWGKLKSQPKKVLIIVSVVFLLMIIFLIISGYLTDVKPHKFSIPVLYEPDYVSCLYSGCKKLNVNTLQLV